MLKGKTVVLGVSGGIAAYKSCEVASRLKKLGANVIVLMTKHATEFVTPLTFETLSGNRVVFDMFDRNFVFSTEHISVAKAADVFVVAPATANLVAKLAGGIADDMLTTTALATKAPMVICPAMNTNMLENAETENNLRHLEERGVHVLYGESGRLACGDVGKGRMAEPEVISDYVENLLQPVRDFKGKKVLITVGGTEEPIDEVRCITNRSSGKMGMAIAKAAADRGAEVVIVKGKVSVPTADGVSETVEVKTTNDMYNAVKALAKECDLFVMAAAPADYKVKEKFSGKLKAEKITLTLEENPDVAKMVGELKTDGQKLVIFSAETENLIENATEKLKKKHADMVVANDVTQKGAGFGSDTNVVSIITPDGKRWDSGVMEKSKIANVILDKIKEVGK